MSLRLPWRRCWLNFSQRSRNPGQLLILAVYAGARILHRLRAPVGFIRPEEHSSTELSIQHRDRLPAEDDALACESYAQYTAARRGLVRQHLGFP